MNHRPTVAVALIALTFIPGCIGLDGFSKHGHVVEKPPTGPVHQVQPLWENRVLTTPDSVNQGKMLPGLAGRIYLFGEEVKMPLAAKGTLTVDAHEILPDGKTRMLERWEFDSVTLQRLCFRDTIGWGYTVFLPWSTYRPDIPRVMLQAKFTPEQQGVPLFSPQSMVSLRQDGPPVITTNIVPAAATK